MRDKRPLHEHEVNHVISQTPPTAGPLGPRDALEILFLPLSIAGGILVWTVFGGAPVHPGLWAGLGFWAGVAGMKTTAF